MVASADLDAVDRVLVNCADDPSACWDEGGACALLIQRGFVPEPAKGVVLFTRPPGYVRATLSADDVDEAFDEDDLTDEDDLREIDEADLEDDLEGEQEAAELEAEGKIDAPRGRYTRGQSTRNRSW